MYILQFHSVKAPVYDCVMDIKGNFDWVCSLVQAVQASYNSSELSDLSIHCSGQVFLVNSLVLASQSDVLKDIVTGCSRGVLCAVSIIAPLLPMRGRGLPPLSHNLPPREIRD